MSVTGLWEGFLLPGWLDPTATGTWDGKGAVRPQLQQLPSVFTWGIWGPSNRPLQHLALRPSLAVFLERESPLGKGSSRQRCPILPGPRQKGASQHARVQAFPLVHSRKVHRRGPGRHMAGDQPSGRGRRGFRRSSLPGCIRH